eukprot:5733636-Amphidinium_carterae.1
MLFAWPSSTKEANSSAATPAAIPDNPGRVTVHCWSRVLGWTGSRYYQGLMFRLNTRLRKYTCDCLVKTFQPVVETLEEVLPASTKIHLLNNVGVFKKPCMFPLKTPQITTTK